MTVKYGNEICTGKDKDSIPEVWCEYGQTWDEYYVDDHDYYGARHYYVTESKNDTAYYDYYYYATAETMVIKEAAGKDFTIDVYHVFEDNQYYEKNSYYYGYEYYDHNMAAHLSIKVGKEEIASELHHEHEYYGFTHDDTGEINEDYDAHFEVKVSCDDSCSCTATYST